MKTQKVVAGFMKVIPMKMILPTSLVSGDIQSFKGPLSRPKKRKEILEWIDGKLQEYRNLHGEDSEKLVFLKFLKTIAEVDSSSKDLNENIIKAVIKNVLRPKPVALQFNMPENSNLSALESIQVLLLQSLREEAVKVAMENGLWVHALIIAGHCNQQIYNNVIIAFSEKTLSAEDPLRTMFLLFGGKQGKFRQNTVSFSCCKRALATIIFSAIAFDIPIAFIG
jgi:hypothetical protein